MHLSATLSFDFIDCRCHIKLCGFLGVECRVMCDAMTFTLGPAPEHVTGQCSAKKQLAALVTRA
jgi:hypothetical protein